MTQLTLEHKKIWVLGLIFNCPTGSFKEDCKMNEIRELSAEKREEKIFEMTEMELESFIKEHKCCLKDRGF